MRTAVTEEFIKRARTSGPLGQLVSACVEDGTVISSRLRDGLKSAGYSVEFEKGKAGHYARVYKPRQLEEGETLEPDESDRTLIAFGYSNSEEDAIKQAMWGAVREEEAGIISA